MVGTPWISLRVARLGFLVGCGFDAQAIGQDSLVNTTVNNVYHQANKLGLRFRDVPRRISVDDDALARLKPAAELRKCTVEVLAEKLLRVLADDPTLVANVLDDGATTG